MQQLTSLFVLICACLLVQVRSLPSGAPSDACYQLIPGHNDNTGSNATQADGANGFYIYSSLFNNDTDGSYTNGTMYKVTLATVSYQFRGFIIQARESDTGELIGSFTLQDPMNSQLLNCSGNLYSTVTHTNNYDKSKISFYWTAPNNTGVVDFRYSVVTTFQMDYYANISALEYRPPCDFPPTPYGEHTLRFGEPGGDYYLGLRQNEYDPTYLDVYLEGEAMGWVAVGFSMNRMMEEDDVLGCSLDGAEVTAVDTWNPTTQYTPNVADATQTDICQHFASFADGRISCRFSRLIEATDAGQDYNLNSTYWLLFGRRTTAQSSVSLARHTSTPDISERVYNPVMDTNVAPPVVPPNVTGNVTNNTCPFSPGSGDDYDFVYGTRGGDYYLATRVNPYDTDYLDIYLEGVADGWVAVGFSMDQQMQEDDVLGCRVTSNGTVVAVDTWNPSPRRRANVLDSTQTDICMHSGNFTDGRITCRFSRLIVGTDSGQDYDLNNEYWLFYGRRAAAQPDTVESLGYHTMNGGMTPTISAQVERVIALPVDVDNNQCSFEPGSDDFIFEFGTAGGDYYLATRINPNNRAYLDIYLEGEADGWVAVGFSMDQQMQEDDVLGCRVANDTVIAVDTWNPSPRRMANVIDRNQTDICMHSGSFTNGRITCRFSRLIDGTDIGQDYDLDDGYWLFYGRRAASQPDGLESFGYHTMNGGETPTISGRTENVAGASIISSSLVLMLVALVLVLKTIN